MRRTFSFGDWSAHIVFLHAVKQAVQNPLACRIRNAGSGPGDPKQMIRLLLLIDELYETEKVALAVFRECVGGRGEYDPSTIGQVLGVVAARACLAVAFRLVDKHHHADTSGHLAYRRVRETIEVGAVHVRDGTRAQVTGGSESASGIAQRLLND